MKIYKNRSSFLLFALLGALSLITGLGCSMFSTKSDAPADSPGFKSDTPATTASLTPMPVEIAQDIAKISAGGQVDPVKPSAPAAAPVANSEALPGENRGPAGSASADPLDTTVIRKPNGGKTISYTVRVGDTLMKIAFEKFGNVYRWKEILQSNRQKLSGGYNELRVGSVLRIDGVEYVVIERNGKPYLIQRHDTLVKISKGLYGTTAQWRALWQNNRQLIHDPNKIYAGFTLYYPPHGQGESKVRPPASVK